MSRLIIKKRIRYKISGTARRPRIAIFRSLHNIALQAIDDNSQRTIASSHTLKRSGSLCEKAKAASEDLAKQLQENKISTAVFDRSGFAYHGAVEIAAQTLREKGITL